MLEQFFPDALSDSIYDIDFKKLYHMGYRGVLFDIDNTLTEHGAPATASVIHFFENLRAIGFTTCLVSNNKAPRILPFAKEVNSYYVCDAKKPRKKGYLAGIEKMGIKKKETLMVGDQIFTDIWGANNAGVYSVLVDPISPKEEIQIVIKRFFERIVLFFYKIKIDKVKKNDKC